MIAFELTLRNNSERTLFHLRRQTLQRCCTSTVCGESGIKNEWSLLYSWTPWGEQGPQLPWLLKLDILLLVLQKSIFLIVLSYFGVGEMKFHHSCPLWKNPLSSHLKKSIRCSCLFLLNVCEKTRSWQFFCWRRVTSKLQSGVRSVTFSHLWPAPVMCFIVLHRLLIGVCIGACRAFARTTLR